MEYIGIDCGLDGAIVRMSDRKNEDKIAMPTISNGKRREIDIDKLSSIFESWGLLDCVLVIEDPGGHAPSAAGLRSMTYSFAVIKTLTIVHRLPYHTVAARKWQSAFWSRPSGKYDTKAAALKAATQIWPDDDWRRNERCKIAFDGFVDAALLAEYGRRNNI